VSDSSRDPYANPELFRFADGMEGVPEWLGPVETPGERARGGWRRTGNEQLAWVGALLPGVAIALLLALVGHAGSELGSRTVLGLEKSPVSPILLAILLGLAIRNTIGIPPVYAAGLELCLKRVLRLGVVLLGIRLSIGALGSIGLVALPIVVASIATALVVVRAACAALGVAPRLGTLVAVGTAICGNTAIVATAPVIGANDDETSYAVGTITVFGLVALITYPFLSHALFAGDAQQAGLFLGTAIHDTAQVAGAALLYAQQYTAPLALDTATVTKLVRNLFMVAVIPLMALLYRRDAAARGSSRRTPIAQLVPLFVLGFVAMALLRTAGDWATARPGSVVAPEQWASAVAFVGTLSEWCLTTAMASVGLGTSLDRLRALGARPLAVGLAAALTVGIVSASALRLALG
jgi:uncharacterized integral membrane protein (TIGR00698 family)